MAVPGPNNSKSKSSDLPRINREITASSVRLIDSEGEPIGVISLKEALEAASEAGLDLVEISPHAEPPVCKLLDFGKYKFEIRKKQQDAKKKQKKTKIKEIKLRPHIDEHDYQVKLRSVQKFLQAGDKVKFSLRFRGREIVHNDLASQLMNRFKEELAEHSKVELEPKLEGRQMVMILVPL